MAVCFHETRETIDLLRRVVNKLDERNGCIAAEELWDGVQCVPANATSSDLTVARHGFRQMEVFSDVLSTLVSTYKSHTSAIRRRARIPRLTVNSLPNEIIHHIVKDALDCTRPIWLIRYSHVSSKILNVILDSPSLWASIPLTLDIPSWLIKTIVTRSAALKLAVDIDIHGSEVFYSRATPQLSSASVVSRLSMMFEHHQRWKELSVSVDNEPEKLIMRNFPSANLTSVRILHVGYQKMGTDFFRKWETPPVEKLDWTNTFYLPPSSMATQTLRVFSLWLCKTDSNFMSLAAFLNAATRLRSLTLNLQFSADNGPAIAPEIKLPCLEHLDIKSIPRTDFGPTAILLKSILCPGLRHLTVMASTHAQYSDLTENMRERYPILTSFTLAAERRYPMEDFFLDDIMCPLPNAVKSLKIKAGFRHEDITLHASRRNDIVSHHFFVTFPNLTVLDLEGCTIQEENFHANLSEMLKSFRVSLNHFRPGITGRARDKLNMEAEKENAIMVLQRAGVLADSI